MNRITVIFTCFNRREKTLRCIKSLKEANEQSQFQFVAVDDNSSDGTREQLEQLGREGYRIRVLSGDGTLFWAGGMRKGIAYAKEKTDTEYYLLVNDDVEFLPGAIDQMAEDGRRFSAENGRDTVLVGPMRDEDGRFSYGGIRYRKGIRYDEVHPEDADRSCDSFNMNCLMLTRGVLMALPNFDRHYIHSLADFDYGLEMKRRGIPVLVTDYYVGICPDNDPKGGWTDRSLPRRERVRQKESIKGAPFAPWFYFLKKNFGMGQALLHAFTPYVRILLGK